MGGGGWLIVVSLDLAHVTCVGRYNLCSTTLWMTGWVDIFIFFFIPNILLFVLQVQRKCIVSRKARHIMKKKKLLTNGISKYILFELYTVMKIDMWLNSVVKRGIIPDIPGMPKSSHL